MSIAQGDIMRICYFGSDDFSVNTLKTLAQSSHEIVAVVTQPDREKGRGQKIQPTPIAQFANSKNIPLYQPVSLKDKNFLQEIESLSVDLTIVCSYGKILNKGLLTCPPKGCINVHPSLLPKYRGASPIMNAIMSGENITGVTIIYMDEGCDTGDIIIQKEYPIDSDDTFGTLREKLSVFSAEVLNEAVQMIEENKAPRCKQPEEGECYTSLLTKENTFIPWEMSCEEVRNYTRALWPTPSAQTRFRGKLLKIGPVKIVNEPEPIDHNPGLIVKIEKNKGPVILTGQGCVQFTEIKPEGKKLMDAWQFTLGYNPRPGEILGSS